MNEFELKQRIYFTRVGLLMAIASLAFLFYVGSSLVHTTKQWRRQMQKVEVVSFVSIPILY